MPKKQPTKDINKLEDDELMDYEVTTDTRQELSLNVLDKVTFWEEIERHIDEKRKKVRQYRDQLAKIDPLDGSQRIKRTELMSLIEDENEKIKMMQEKCDPTNYLVCVAKIIKTVTEKKEKQLSDPLSVTNGNTQQKKDQGHHVLDLKSLHKRNKPKKKRNVTVAQIKTSMYLDHVIHLLMV